MTNATTKKCTKCGETKTLTEYYKSKLGKLGLNSQCKKCMLKHQKSYNKSEAGKANNLKAVTKYSKTSKGKKVRSKANNKYETTEKAVKSREEYNKSTYGKAVRAAHKSLRRDKATCELTNEERKLVNALYRECKELNKEAGYTKYHVDHVKPVAKGGKTHPNNLQILTATENLKKGTKYNG